MRSPGCWQILYETGASEKRRRESACHRLLNSGAEYLQRRLILTPRLVKDSYKAMVLVPAASTADLTMVGEMRGMILTLGSQLLQTVLSPVLSVVSATRLDSLSRG